MSPFSDFVDVCHCPIKTDRTTVNVNSGLIELHSVCSGKPCNCDSDTTSCEVHMHNKYC